MKVVQNGSKGADLSCKMVALVCARLGMRVIHCTRGMKLRLLIHKRQPSVQFIVDSRRYHEQFTHWNYNQADLGSIKASWPRVFGWLVAHGVK